MEIIENHFICCVRIPLITTVKNKRTKPYKQLLNNSLSTTKTMRRNETPTKINE